MCRQHEMLASVINGANRKKTCLKNYLKTPNLRKGLPKFSIIINEPKIKKVQASFVGQIGQIYAFFIWLTVTSPTVYKGSFQVINRSTIQLFSCFIPLVNRVVS